MWKEEDQLDYLERRLELVRDLELALDLELARGGELDLGHHLEVHHHLEVDIALGLVHEVEGLHFVLRKHVGLGEVMAPLVWSIILLREDLPLVRQVLRGRRPWWDRQGCFFVDPSWVEPSMDSRNRGLKSPSTWMYDSTTYRNHAKNIRVSNCV